MVEVGIGSEGEELVQNNVVEDTRDSLYQKLKGSELSSEPMPAKKIEELKIILADYKGKEKTFFMVHGEGEIGVTPEEYYKRCVRALAVEEAKTTTNVTALCDMIDADIKADGGKSSEYFSGKITEEEFEAIFTSHRLPRQLDGKELPKVRALLEGGVGNKFAKFLLEKGYCGLFSPLAEAIMSFIKPAPPKETYQKLRSELSVEEQKAETDRVTELFKKNSKIDLFPSGVTGPVGAGEKVQITFHKGINYSNTYFGKYLENHKMSVKYLYCKGSATDAHVVFEVTGGIHNGKIAEFYRHDFHHISGVREIPQITFGNKK